MTGAELKHIREAKGWTLAQMGLALGYDKSPAIQCWRLENEYQGRKVPEWRASKAEALQFEAK